MIYVVKKGAKVAKIFSPGMPEDDRSLFILSFLFGDLLISGKRMIFGVNFYCLSFICNFITFRTVRPEQNRGKTNSEFFFFFPRDQLHSFHQNYKRLEVSQLELVSESKQTKKKFLINTKVFSLGGGGRFSIFCHIPSIFCHVSLSPSEPPPPFSGHDWFTCGRSIFVLL